MILTKGGVMMLNLYKKIAWTGISMTGVTTFINALISGSNIWTALSVAGIAAGGGVGTAIATIGRAAIVKFVKRWGVKKAAAW
ncbi:MAG: putative cyclic bacteriocin [Staphylococcus epidermidis]|uniref:putative cyclic bacteriocin n=1 Tax=Staphylococcus epidermidis TaxID=1282 RepID=UPI0029096DD5|nr:putative cyclic bacteriocin [Staphylococcus epidermidis]